MDKNSIWKWIILVGLTAWSLSLVLPLNEKIKLGIDLAGGSRFVLEVDLASISSDAARDAHSRALEVIRNRVDNMGIAEPVIYTEPGNRIVVEVPGMSTKDRDRALKNLQSAAFLEFRMVHARNEEYVSKLFEKGQAPIGYRIVDATEMGRTDKYYMWDKAVAPTNVTEADCRDKARNFEPRPGYELLLEKVVINEQELWRPSYVSKRRELTGEALRDASMDYDQIQRPYVRLSFNSRGARQFGNLTKDYAPGGAQNPNINERRQLAIVLDGTLYSAPSINEPIMGGNAQITGNFSIEEAQNLAIVLRAGALPAPVKLIEERTIDPTLGADSVASGKNATLAGMAAVFLFMILYYTLAGVVADVALLMNLVLLPVGLIFVQGFFSMMSAQGPGGISLPTLTLPGIAGIALTIGMAVDASVLIFERMREEQAAGKRFKFVVDAGYDKAFSAIFDSNITTLISAAILFWQGTGPVRGYAVTLAAGIIVSMYSTLVVSRMVFDMFAQRAPGAHLRMFSFLKAPKIDFLGKRAIFVTISLVVILGTWGLFAARGAKNFGIDFTGGTSITYEFAEKQPVDAVRGAIEAAGIKNPSVQYHNEAGQVGGKEYLEVRVGFDDAKKATESVQAAFPSAAFHIHKEDSVGPQIGKELQKKAIVATALSLLAIIIYVSVRFEFPFAVGAVVALLHDVLVAVGVFCALGGQLSVPMVAAVLTIIGYSVNDTIVIFDRIRENLKFTPNRPFAEMANESLNQTLSRTILTSFATMLTVVALLLFGGGSIFDFTLVLFIGMISGVYSTIYIATPVVLLWHKGKPGAAVAAATAATPSKAK